MTMKRLLVALAFLLTWSLPAAADNDADAENYVITLNSGEGTVQGAALELARELASSDNTNVHVVLCGDAGELALEQNIPPSLEPRSVSPKEMLMESMTADAQVYLCHLFLPNSLRRYDEDDVDDGIGQINPERMAELIREPNTQVLGY